MPTMKYDKRVERLLVKLEESKGMSEVNRDVIRRFHRHLVMDNYSDARKDKYLNTLIKIAENVDFDFEDATKENIEDFVFWINGRKDVGDVTKTDYKKLLKCFYRWIGKGEYPECIGWMKTNGRRREGKLPEEMLEEDEVILLIDTAKTPRDRAIIALLWETGARMGELIDLRVGSFEDHKHGLKIVVDGKTGQRRLPLIDSVPHVNAWIDGHPNRKDPKAPMWVNIGTRNNGNKMEYPAIIKMLKLTAKRAGISKPMHPHHFRHSRATYLATRFTEAQLCQWFGWVLGSNVPARYVHLSGRDMDVEYARLHGIEEEAAPKVSKLTPKKCPRCKHKLPPDADYCYKCGMALELKFALEAAEYESIDEVAREKMLRATLENENIDLRLLAKLVAEEKEKEKKDSS